MLDDAKAVPFGQYHVRCELVCTSSSSLDQKLTSWVVRRWVEYLSCAPLLQAGSCPATLADMRRLPPAARCGAYSAAHQAHPQATLCFPGAPLLACVLRRYREFAELDALLRARMGWRLGELSLPGKGVPSKIDDGFLEERRASLDAYVPALLTLLPPRPPSQFSTALHASHL